MANRSIGYLRYSIGKRKTNPSDKDSEEKFVAMAQARESIDINLLAQHMSEHGSPFTSGTIKGVIEDAVTHIIELLRQGYSVRLDGLCSLRLTFRCEPQTLVENVIPSNVVKKVNIRALVDESAVNAVNSNIEYEYVMTRAAQAAAKKAAKEKLATNGADNDKPADNDNNGGGDNNGGDVTE